MIDKKSKQDTSMAETCYDFPIGMNFIRKWHWTKYIPFCPTFDGGCCGKTMSPTDDTLNSMVDSHKNIKENGTINEGVYARKLTTEL